MKKINLKTGEFEARPSGGSSTSLMIGTFLLAVVISMAGWLYWEKQSIRRAIEETESQIKQRQAELNKTNLKEVYDFENRVINVKDQMETHTNPVTALSKIAGATLAETYFLNLEIGSGAGFDSIEGSIIVPDFPALARQINVYGELAGVDNFVLSNSGYAEGGVQASIAFDLATQGDEDLLVEE